MVRRTWVLATPEEKVRQSLLQKMVLTLGFPKGLLAVEKAVGQRRFDLVCYTKEGNALLLVECKAFDPEEAAENQAFGYNLYCGAPFLCVAGPNCIQTLWHEGGQLKRVSFLPFFQELYAFSQRL